jgi:hypothetical protein
LICFFVRNQIIICKTKWIKTKTNYFSVWFPCQYRNEYKIFFKYFLLRFAKLYYMERFSIKNSRANTKKAEVWLWWISLLGIFTEWLGFYWFQQPKVQHFNSQSIPKKSHSKISFCNFDCFSRIRPLLII